MKKNFVKLAACSLMATIMAVSVIFSAAGCKYTPKKIAARELTAAYSLSNIRLEGKEIGEKTVSGLDNFGVELLKSVVKDKSKSNVLVSPFSAFACLGMIANGAENETLAEFEKTLGADIASVNLIVNKMLNAKDGAVKLADSVWIKNGAVNIEEDYLKTVKEIYDAEIYSSDFNAKTVQDVNNWCSNKTDGMIPEIIEEIEPQDVLYAINALLFDAKWQTAYEKKDISKYGFTCLDGGKTTVEMLLSTEYAYLDFGNAQGFLKSYKGSKYSFLGVLPNEGVNIYDFVNGLTGDKYYEAMNAKQSVKVNAGIPEFTFDYSANLSENLKDMGIRRAFEPSGDFAKMGKTVSGDELYLGYFLQKTKIELDRNGTKAAAISFGGMKGNSAPAPEKEYEIILNRPFTFGIVENATGLPLFLGAVTRL